MKCYVCTHIDPHAEGYCTAEDCECESYRLTPVRCLNCGHERLHDWVNGTLQCLHPNGCGCSELAWDIMAPPAVSVGNLATVKNLLVIASNGNDIVVKPADSDSTITVSRSWVTSFAPALPTTQVCTSLFYYSNKYHRCHFSSDHDGNHSDSDFNFAWKTSEEHGRLQPNTLLF